MEMTYVLEGDPTALARPRFGTRKIYDSQKHLKLWAAITVKNQHREKKMFEGPLLLHIIFYFGIPKTRAKNLKEEDLHFYKPDLSNCIKYVEDVCNKIVYNDDCMIAKITAEKRYSNDPRTIFTISNLL